MGGCQNYGPFLGTLNIRCRSILRTQKGTIILTATQVGLGVRGLGLSPDLAVGHEYRTCRDQVCASQANNAGSRSWDLHSVCRALQFCFFRRKNIRHEIDQYDMLRFDEKAVPARL